jgi:hypothetical protein
LDSGVSPGLAIVSDDAGPCNILLQGLCWVRAERWVRKLIPLHKDHRQDIARVRDPIWSLYAHLKAYKAHPTAAAQAQREQRFDTLFTQKTRFSTLNQTLKRICRKKAELLLVVERPEVPLHTHDSERDLRDYVKKKKVSGGTRSDLGRRCRDTFASMKETCRKLGISFWDYLCDRISGAYNIPPLPHIVSQRLAEP